MLISFCVFTDLQRAVFKTVAFVRFYNRAFPLFPTVLFICVEVL